MLDEVGFEDPIFGVDGFEEGSLVNLDFEDDFFGVEASGGGGMAFGDVAFGNAPGVTFGGALEGVAWGGAALGVGSGGGATLESFFFEADAVAFDGVSFPPAFFGVATTAGWGSGARSMRDATGALVVAAENCPLAIWRARSFTLMNMLTVQKSTRTAEGPGPGGCARFLW